MEESDKIAPSAVFIKRKSSGFVSTTLYKNSAAHEETILCVLNDRRRGTMGRSMRGLMAVVRVMRGNVGSA